MDSSPGACPEVVQRLRRHRWRWEDTASHPMVQLNRFPLQALQAREEMYRRSYRNYVRTTVGDSFSVGEGNWRRHGTVLDLDVLRAEGISTIASAYPNTCPSLPPFHSALH